MGFPWKFNQGDFMMIPCGKPNLPMPSAHFQLVLGGSSHGLSRGLSHDLFGYLGDDSPIKKKQTNMNPG